MERMKDIRASEGDKEACESMTQIKLGELVVTRGIENEMEETYGFKSFCMHCVLRHRDRDWGDLDPEDIQSNDYAADHHERILSAYSIPKFYCLGYVDKILVITEADRSVTTILFPYEY